MNQVSINTTQNVDIQFSLASLGDRMVAYLIDELLKLAYVIGVVIIADLFNINDLFEDDWSIMAIYSILFLPAMLYSLLLESFLEGQTIGKKIMKTKVVKIDGYQASFGDYLARWAVRIVDIYSNSGVIGAISIIASKNAQRLGDIVAGTAVISLKNKYTIDSTILQEIGDAYVPIYPTVVRLSDNDMRIIKNSFDIALPKGDLETIRMLRLKVEEVTGAKNVSGNDKDYIRTIIKDFNFYTQNMS